MIALAALSAPLAGCGVSSLDESPRTGSSTAATETRPAVDPPPVDPAHVKGPHDHPIPILMYHVVAAPPADAPYPGLYVLPDDFAAQIEWLAASGYHAVTLDQVYAYWHDGVALPRHPIVLTFDDGYRSVFVNALPVLRAKHWPGVLNLLVRNESTPWGLSPRRIRALIAAGWEVDAHTLTHPDLTTLDPAALRREIQGSRRRIQRQFDQPVNFFCYPAGRYDAAVVAAVRAAGYLGATTVRDGLGRPSELFTLARIRIDGTRHGIRGLVASMRAFGKVT